MSTIHDPRRAIWAIVLCVLAVLLFPLVWLIPAAPASGSSLDLAAYPNPSETIVPSATPTPSDFLFLPYAERGVPTVIRLPIPAAPSTPEGF